MIGPIWRTLRKHKTAALLIVLETALACAIVANALHLVGERLRVLARPEAVPAAELLVIHTSLNAPQSEPQNRDTLRRDLAALRALPGVVSATFVNQMPYAGSNNFSSLSTDESPDARSFHANMYAAEPAFAQTLGLRFSQGGPFDGGPTPYTQDALADFGLVPPGVIINKELADAMYPGEPALGKPIYMTRRFTITGVADNLPLTNPKGKPEGRRFAALFQVQPAIPEGFHVVRAPPGLAPAARTELAQRVRTALLAVQPQRQVNWTQWQDDMRRDYDASDRQMAGLMAGVTAVLLLVTTGGVVGLMSFWVQQRTRMIGTRRALGATRGQVLRYFLMENALLTGTGIVLGMVAAYGLSIALKSHWEVPALPAWYLPVGAAVLLLLGQVAVWIPARRAAGVSPVVALRS